MFVFDETYFDDLPGRFIAAINKNTILQRNKYYSLKTAGSVDALGLYVTAPIVIQTLINIGALLVFARVS